MNIDSMSVWEYGMWTYRLWKYESMLVQEYEVVEV